MRKLFVIIAAASLLLSGCGVDVSGEATRAVRAAESSDSADEEMTGQIAEVGSDFSYNDGLSVQLVSLKKVKRDPYAAGGTRNDYVVVATVKITNGTKSTFDPSMSIVSAASGPDGDEVESVFQDGVDGSFSGIIPSGRSRTAKFGLAIPREHIGEILVTILPGWDYEEAAFEGTI